MFHELNLYTIFYAEAFLEDDETVDAEVFLNKASSCIQTVTEISLLLRYRVTYARVLDANRKFVEAAMRYYDLSNTTYADVSRGGLGLMMYKSHSLYPLFSFSLSLLSLSYKGEPGGSARASREGSHLCGAR
jgi:hypothetical protein